MSRFVTTYRDLRVYRNARKASMEIFQITKGFPGAERYSMTDQIRRSSRSVCTNLAEGWRKRRYKAAFIAKLSDAESEACETQVWLDFARSCEYLDDKQATSLEEDYERIMAQIVSMIDNADKWLIKQSL